MRKTLWLYMLAVVAVAQNNVTTTTNIGLQVPAYNQPSWQVPLDYDLNLLDKYLSGNLALPGLALTYQATAPNGIAGSSVLYAAQTDGRIYLVTPLNVAYQIPLRGATTYTSGHCVAFDANGNQVDAGLACGSSAAGGSTNSIQYNSSGTLGGISLAAGQILIGQSSGAPAAQTLSGACTLAATGVITCPTTSAGFGVLTSGTNTAATMVIGTGASLSTTGSGAIVATSVPVADVTGLTFTGSTTKAISSTGSITTGDCLQWDASGNAVDLGATCNMITQTGTGAVAISTQNAINVLGFTPDQFGAVGNGTANDTAAVNAAFAAAAAGNRYVYLPKLYGIVSPILIPNNMTGGRISGAGQNSGLLALSSFSGGAMLTSDGGDLLSDLTIENMFFGPNSVAAVVDVLNLTFSPESSVRNHIRNVRIIGLPANANGLLLTGSEDTTVEDVAVTGTSGSGAIALNWTVVDGNCNIINPTWYIQMELQYQVCSITGGTIGTINTGGVAGVMTLNGVYSYANTVGPTTANIIASASGGGQHNFIINGGLFGGSAGQTSALMFYGGFNAGRVQVNGAYITNGGATTYSVFNSATTGTNASFTFDGTYFVSASLGSPGSGVAVSNTSQPRSSFLNSYFYGASPVVQTGAATANSYPIQVTQVEAVSSVFVSGCSTPMVVGIYGYPSTYLTLANSAAQWGTGVIAVPITGASTINVITQAVGCTNGPTNVQVTAEIQPQ
jgi:hypothetical protein